MSGIKNSFSHYISPAGNDCYTPNFESDVTRITVWNDNAKQMVHAVDRNGLEISVEFINGFTKLHKYSEFEAVLNDVYGRQEYGAE